MHDLELPQNRSSIRGQNHLLQMVNDDLVTAERAQGRQHGRGNGVAGIDVADDSTIFARVSVDNSVSTFLIWAVESRGTHDW